MKILLMVGLIFISANPANATLIDTGNTTRDTSTNLEWLDLTFTFGKTFNNAISEYEGEGWRSATEQEYQAMFDSNFSSFESNSSWGEAQNASKCFPDHHKLTDDDMTIFCSQIKAASDLFGAYRSSEINVFSLGMFEDRNGVLRLNGWGFTNLWESGRDYSQLTGYAYRDYSLNYDLEPSDYRNREIDSWGTFLVREVNKIPEPSTIILMSLGLIGIFLKRIRPSF